MEYLEPNSGLLFPKVFLESFSKIFLRIFPVDFQMASKNKKIKEPIADRSIFNMVRDYCRPPWVSTNKELPKCDKPVLLAYYGGEDVGYKIATGWLHKRVIKKNKKYKAFDLIESKKINVNESDDHVHRHSNYVDYNYNDYEKEENLASNYEVIEEDGEKKALMWFVCVTGDLPGIFCNSKSADSTFFSDPNLLQSAEKEYTKPDFWMYIPDIK